MLLAVVGVTIELPPLPINRLFGVLEAGRIVILRSLFGVIERFGRLEIEFEVEAGLEFGFEEFDGVGFDVVEVGRVRFGLVGVVAVDEFVEDLVAVGVRLRNCEETKNNNRKQERFQNEADRVSKRTTLS